MDIATPIPGRPPMPFLGPRGSALSGLGDATSDTVVAAINAANQAYQATLLAGQPGLSPYTTSGYLAVQPGMVSGGISGGTVLMIGLVVAAIWMAKNR